MSENIGSQIILYTCAKKPEYIGTYTRHSIGVTTVRSALEHVKQIAEKEFKKILDIRYFAIVRRGARVPTAWGFCVGDKCDCLDDHYLNDGDRVFFFVKTEKETAST